MSALTADRTARAARLVYYCTELIETVLPGLSTKICRATTAPFALKKYFEPP